MRSPVRVVKGAVVPRVRIYGAAAPFFEKPVGTECTKIKVYKTEIAYKIFIIAFYPIGEIKVRSVPYCFDTINSSDHDSLQEAGNESKYHRN